MIETVTLLTGLAAGFMSGFIGGGAGIIIAPMLLFMGLPPHMSVGTARIGAFGLSIGSLFRFLRSNEIIWSFVIPLIVMSIPAAFLGAYLVLSLEPSVVEKAIGVILIVAAYIMYQNEKRTTPDRGMSKWISYPIFFLARTIQAAFGAGVGLLLTVVYVKLMGLTVRQSSATKRLPGIVVILITTVIFGLEGIIDYELGAILFGGSLIGGYAGAHTALAVDQKFVTRAFAALAFAFGVFLLF